MEDVMKAAEPEKIFRQPEQCLVAEVLCQAIADLANREKDVRLAARNWLKYEGDEPFSVRWCCLQLGLHISIINKALGLSDPSQCKPLCRRNLYGTRRGFNGYLPRGTKLRVA